MQDRSHYHHQPLPSKFCEMKNDISHHRENTSFDAELIRTKLFHKIISFGSNYSNFHNTKYCLSVV